MTAPIYDIDFADLSVDPSKKSFTIAPGELNTTDTSLKLPGAGYAPYGEPIIEDLVRLLESFASDTAPLNPTIGQLWYHPSSSQLKVLAGISTVGTNVTYNWINVSNNTYVSPVAPDDRTRLWYDVGDANPINHTLKIFNAFANSWQPVVPNAVQFGNVAPSTTLALWYNTSNPIVDRQELYAYNPTAAAWQPAVSHAAELLTGNVPSERLTTSNIGGNAATATLAAAATKLATGRTISLSNGATGSALFDGTANVTINVTALNANILTAGTVPVDRLGSAGTRAVGYYLAGNNVWTQMPYIPDAYTKVETDALLSQKAFRDSITYVGMAGNNPDLPYMRRESDNTVYYLQRRLGYTPAPVATTLAGYGITDAYTKTQIDAMIPGMNTGQNATPGYIRFPNGLTLQWGIGPSIGDDSSTTITLPKPGTILNVTATYRGGVDAGIGPAAPMINTITTTSFRVSNNWDYGRHSFYWFAITVTTA